MYHRQSRPCGNEFTDDNYNFLTIQHNDQVRNAMTMSILTDKSLCGSNSPLLSDIVQIINSFASQEDFITIVVKKVSDLAKSTTELTELTRMVVPRDFFQCFANDVGVSSGRYGRVVYVHRQDLLFPDLADAIMENGQTSSYELVMLNDAYWSMNGFTELWRYTIHRFNERDTFRLPKPLRSNSLSDQMPVRLKKFWKCYWVFYNNVLFFLCVIIG